MGASLIGQFLRGVDPLEEIQAPQGHESLRTGRVDYMAAMASAKAARPSRTAAGRSGIKPNKLAVISRLTTRLTRPMAMRDLVERKFINELIHASKARRAGTPLELHSSTFHFLYR